MCDRHPIQCIIPPDLLEHLLKKAKDPERRQKLLNTLNFSAYIRGKRSALSSIAVGASVGTKRRAIYSAANGTSLPGTIKRREGDPPSSDSSVNEVYDGFGATYDLYYEEYGRNSLDDRGLLLIGTVHYDQDYDNAFWDGTQMVFGDGDGIDFTRFTKSIDVIGHELTHGVVQYTCNLEYRFQPGALNESFADVFGSLVKQRVRNQKARDATWLIGEDIFTPGTIGDALRSLKDPGHAFPGDRSVGHMSDFLTLPEAVDQGGVHWNSGIPNHAFFYLATDLDDYAWKDAGRIWYLTMRRLTESSDFQEAANVTFASAGEIFGTNSRQQKAVRGAWENVGINVGKTKVGKPVAAAQSADVVVDRFDGQMTRMTQCIEQINERLERLEQRI